MLIVEDGSGLADAESYVAIADADAFWSDRNTTRWLSLDIAVKEACLRQGFDYLGLAFNWPGQPLLTAQRGAWPRGLAYDRNGVAIGNSIVPPPVAIANILLGLEALTTELLQTATADPALSRKDFKIGPITINREYDVTKQPRGLPRFPAVDAVLGGIAGVKAAGGIRTVRLIRG